MQFVYASTPNGYSYQGLLDKVRTTIADYPQAEFHQNLKSFASLKGKAMCWLTDRDCGEFLRQLSKDQAKRKYLPKGSCKASLSMLLLTIGQG